MPFTTSKTTNNRNIMNEPKLTIVLPYLSNSPCIDICKNFLKQNTVNEYELIEIIDETDIYLAYNKGAHEAKYDTIVLLNDDMFVSPGWDLPYVKFCKPKTVITGHLIESGRVPVNPVNFEYDCGRQPETFDYNKFINFINTVTKEIPEVVENVRGWYMPIAFHKSTFIDYPNYNKYPYPNDIDLIDKILPILDFKFMQVNSFMYHLQNYTATYA